MALKSTHPDFDIMFPTWQRIRDCHSGPARVRAAREKYLPETPGMRQDGFPKSGTEGTARYDAYLARAVYHDVVKEAVNTITGAMWAKPPVIDLPPALEPLRERAGTAGETVEEILGLLNVAQWMPGRIGMLLDLPAGETTTAIPRIALYSAEAIRNWAEGQRGEDGESALNFVVLDEQGLDRSQGDGLEHQVKQRYRVLVLGDIRANEAVGAYRAGSFDEGDGFSEAGLVEPSFRGRKLDKIPFVMVNPCDLKTTPSDAPLEYLSEIALAIYRGEADRRQVLFAQGQDTLVISGPLDEGDAENKQPRTGAGALLHLTDPAGSAQFVGIQGQGLAEMRTAITDDMQTAADLGGNLVDTKGRARESAEALGIRVAARTANLRRVALNGAAALQRILRIAAEWVGADPNAVVVTPNLDFALEELAASDVVDFALAARDGAIPWSAQSQHELLRRKDLTRLTYQEELAAIAIDQERRLAQAEALSATQPEPTAIGGDEAE